MTDTEFLCKNCGWPERLHTTELGDSETVVCTKFEAGRAFDLNERAEQAESLVRRALETVYRLRYRVAHGADLNREAEALLADPLAVRLRMERGQ